MSKKRIAAGELMRQLEADPEWVAKRAERERELEEREIVSRSDEAMMVAEIRRVGYDIDSVWALVNNAPHPVLVRRFVGPYERAYPILLRHLDVPHLAANREGIIRALTVRDGGITVEASLLREFERETDPMLKWVLANALRTAMPYHRRRKHPAIREVLKAGATKGRAI